MSAKDDTTSTRGSTKDKLIEAAIDIGKTCIYLLGGLTLLHFSDEKIVDYLGRIEKLKALREASLEYRNEGLESSTRLLRSSKRLGYSAYTLESSLASSTTDHYEKKVFRESAEEFLGSLRAFLSYSTDFSQREEGNSLSQAIEEILETLSVEELKAEDRRRLRIDIIILNSKLSKFVLKLTQ